MKLMDFKALTFDCYGTLIDWQTGILSGLQPLVQKADITPSRDQILDVFAQNESAQEEETPATPYSALLSIVYKRISVDEVSPGPPQISPRGLNFEEQGCTKLQIPNKARRRCPDISFPSRFSM
jgi:hypothetical protein